MAQTRLQNNKQQWYQHPIASIPYVIRSHDLILANRTSPAASFLIFSIIIRQSIFSPSPIVPPGGGTPEIDIFEAEREKANPTSQVASQSVLPVAFMHELYIYPNDTTDKWTMHNTSMTVPNTYHSSAAYVGLFLLIDDALLML